MTLEDIKIYGLNLVTVAITMTQIETMLKILLLIASIGYTISKWIEIYKNNDGKGN